MCHDTLGMIGSQYRRKNIRSCTRIIARRENEFSDTMTQPRDRGEKEYLTAIYIMMRDDVMKNGDFFFACLATRLFS